MSLHVHVASRAERLVASTSQYNDAYVEGFTTVVKGLRHFPYCLRCESVTIAWAIDGYFRYVVILFKEDFLKVKAFNRLPFSFLHKVFLFFIDYRELAKAFLKRG